jgi:hypothetical protein
MRSVDAEGVNIRLHQIAEGSIYHSMSSDAIRAGKPARDDRYPEMASSIARTSVPGVTMAVIDDFELLRRKRCFEALTNPRHALVLNHRHESPDVLHFSTERSSWSP